MEKSQAEIDAKLSVLERMIAGARSDVSGILPDAPRVGEVLEAVPGYEDAVGRSLGDVLDFVIVDEVIRLADDRETLQALPGMIPRRPFVDGGPAKVCGDGVIGPLADYLKMPEELQPVAAAVAHRMWLVRDLQAALTLHAAGAREAVYVTVDGMIVERSGMVRTKTAMNKYAEVLKARTERAELLTLREDLELKLGEARQSLELERERLRALRDDLGQLNERSRQVDRELEHEGYQVIKAEDGRAGLELAEKGGWDLMLLDIMLPGLNGLEVLRRLRRTSELPVIMLTARDAVMDKVTGLDTGADDYLIKPFAFDELLARVRALLRRDGDSKTSGLKVGGLSMNTVSREVRWQGQLLNLTTKEYSILEYFMRHPDAILTRKMIEEHAWNYDLDSISNLVDVYIRRIRQKINPAKGKVAIQTIRGIGYRINAL